MPDLHAPVLFASGPRTQGDARGLDMAEARSRLAEIWGKAQPAQSRSRRLRRHGIELRRALLEKPGWLAAGSLQADSPEADLLAVRRFALGWADDERASPPDAHGAARFEAALDALLAGLAPGEAEGARRLHKRLWTLLSVARESSDVVYSRAAGLPELDRRILLLLFGSDEHTPKEIARLTGADKAQISRSTRRLTDTGLIDRMSVRRPLVLTPEGRALTARLRRMFEERSREVVLGIEPAALACLLATLDAVDGNAIALFEEERGLAAPTERLREAHAADLVHSGRPRRQETIVTRLITLLVYIQRSAALAYKRLTGLSTFEAWVLSEVAEAPPIEWRQLATVLARDESQAARTVRRLVERGLVERVGAADRRNGLLRPTAEGTRVHGIVEAEGWRRDRLLLRDLSPETVRAFLGALDRMTWNVQAQLLRDLAVQANAADRA